MDNSVIEQSHVFFDDFENIFNSLNSDIKDYTDGFWGTNVLIELTPFDFERSQIKRGKRLSKNPKNKADKFFHIQNEKGNVVAVFGYIQNYEEPGDYIFIQRDKIYRFDILKNLTSIRLNSFNNDILSESVLIYKNGNYIAESYQYDNLNRLVKIEREHKDKGYFRDTDFFPDNIYSSIFILEYADSDTQPSKILWNANTHKEFKQIWVKE